MRSLCPFAERFLPAPPGLTTHRREQYTAFERRSTPATHRVPHSGHSTSLTPPCTAANRVRNRRSVRHCLARHAEEQNTASGREPDLSRSPQARQFLSPARPVPLDTTPA